MSSAPLTPVLRESIRPAPTTEALDYANLAQIDISKWFDPDQRASLLEDIRHAVHEVGFWFVTGHGIDDVEVRRQLAIGRRSLICRWRKRGRSLDFKHGKCVAPDSCFCRLLSDRTDGAPTTRSFFGFREGTRTIGDTDVKDNSEALNLPKITPVLAHEVPSYDFILVRHLSPNSCASPATN